VDNDNLENLILAAKGNSIGEMLNIFNANAGFQPTDQAPFFKAIINELERIDHELRVMQY
jgi:hypothetical protein